MGQYLDWITQGPLALSGVSHKMPRNLEKLLMKYDPYKVVKAEDHLDNFYMNLQMLEVRYDDVADRIFPCTLDGRATVWYQTLPLNLIHNWRGFKKLVLEKFVDDKKLSMILRELGNHKIEQKQKVKDFNQRFNHILNRFPLDMKPHDSITIDYFTSTL